MRSGTETAPDHPERVPDKGGGGRKRATADASSVPPARAPSPPPPPKQPTPPNPLRYRPNDRPAHSRRGAPPVRDRVGVPLRDNQAGEGDIASRGGAGLANKKGGRKISSLPPRKKEFTFYEPIGSPLPRRLNFFPICPRVNGSISPAKSPIA